MKHMIRKFILLSLPVIATPVMAQTVAPSAIRPGISATYGQQNKAAAQNEGAGLAPTPAEKGASTTPAKTAPLRTWCEDHGEIILAGGIAGVHTRDSHMQVTSTETDTLAQTNSYRWDSGIAQLGVGYVHYFVDGPRCSNDLRWFPTFEPRLSLYYSNLDINGDIYQFNSVLLNDLRYRTSITNTRLLVDGVLTIVSKGRSSIYGLLGVGLGWSSLNYRDKAGSVTRVELDTERESNTVWEFGAGVSYLINKRWNVSLEYVWTDLGRMHTANTGTADQIITPQLQGAEFQVTTQAILLGLHVAFS